MTGSIQISIILFMKICVYSCLIEAQNNTSDVHLFLDLLKMQNENCGTDQMCTVENEAIGNGITFDQTERSCCLQCFCSTHCKNNETCCPDIQILDVISSDQYGNISKYTNVFEHFEMGEHATSHLSPKLEGNNNMKTCISSRLIHRDITYGLIGIRESFLAISRCPISHRNDVIKLRCEDITAEDWTMIADRIPVTSISTNYIYRNIFCLQCNEGLATDFITWRSFLTCNYKNVVQNFIQVPENLYRRIASKSFSYCNIVFKPPIEVQPFVEDCFQTDIHSCIKTNQGDSNITSDATTPTFYEEICKRYLLPVITIHKRSFTVYRNIACYLCNNKETLPDICYIMYPDHTEYHLEINMINKTTNQPPSTRNISPSGYLHTNYDDKCGLGYTHDENMELCRKVLCPRHFYIHEGTCVPIISYMEGVFFNFILEIKPGGDIPASGTFLEQYESQLESKLTNEVNIVFQLLQINIWRKTSKSNLDVNVVSVDFKNEQFTYSKMIERSRRMMSKIGDIKVELNSTVITVDAKLSDNVYEINRYNNAIERETRSNLQAIREYSKLKVDEKKFILSKGHFCYRMELNSSEIIRLRKNVYKILNTGVRVEGEYFDATEERNQIACIDDIIEVKDKDRNKISKSVVKVDNDFTTYLIFGIFIALMILIVIGMVIFGCRNNET